MRALSWCVAVVSVVSQAGCQCGQCSPKSTVDWAGQAWAASHVPDASCDDEWVCSGSLVGSGTFEVRCTGYESADGGWQSCQCLRDGKPERQLGRGGPWCNQGSPDTFERIIDANASCGWSMPTTGI